MTTDYDVVNVLREYHYDPVLVDAANEIDALRAEVAAQRTRADAMAGEAIKHEARAEQLAEALRYAVDNPEFDSETFDKMARTALRDHDQRERW